MPLHWYLLYLTPTPTGQESPPLSLHQPAMVAEERGLQSLAMDLCTTLFPFLWCPQLLYLLMEPTMLFTRDTLGLLDPTRAKVCLARASQGASDLQILDMLFHSTMSLMFFLLSQLYPDMASTKLIHLGPLTSILRRLKVMLLENRIESVYEAEI